MKREGKYVSENIFKEIKVEYFTNLAKDLQIQEDEKFPNRRNSKKWTPIHIVMKVLKTKDKEKILEVAAK